MPHKKRVLHLTPPQAIMLSFAIMIFIGTMLLSLPIASKSGESVGFLNALFTATSANCVTGLVVVNTLEHWSIFGKLIILALIQLGALGFITIMTFSMLVLKQRVSLRNRIIIQAAFNQNSVGGMVRFVRQVIYITVWVEFIGAVLLAIAFYASGTMTALESVVNGIFHSISAFCNAGFDILGTDSLMPYQDNVAINIIIMALIIIGGLGFTVWGELIFPAEKHKKRSFRYRMRHLSLHSKIAILITLILLNIGFLFFLLIEWSNPDTLGPMSIPNKILAALFQSVTLRTAGFNTISQDGLTDFSTLVSSVFMFIGGSPAGTAGGSKTVTLGVVIIAMISVLRGKNCIVAFGRTLPNEMLQKALTVICTMLIVVFTAVFLLHFTEQNNPYYRSILDLVFEASSAAGTVGVTTGITPHLSPLGKVIITFCMFVGRLSPAAAAVALNMKMRTTVNNLMYPEEPIIIG